MGMYSSIQVVLVLCVATLITQETTAKIIVNLKASYSDAGYLAIVEKWDAETNEKIFRYDVKSSYGQRPETVDHITIKHGGYLYATGNNLGQIEILRLNTETGMTDGAPFASFLGGGQAMEFDYYGDLFTTGGSMLTPNDPEADYESRNIYRFDGESRELKGMIDFGETEFVADFDILPGGDLLYALHGSSNNSSGFSSEITAYRYSLNDDLFVELNSFPVKDHVSHVYVGLDGLLYVSDHNGDVVDRYTSDGVFVDQFMDDYVYDFQYLEGKLIGLTGDSRIVEIDQINGSIVDTLIDTSSYQGTGTLSFRSMSAFSVPEPTSACLLPGGLALLARSRKRIR